MSFFLQKIEETRINADGEGLGKGFGFLRDFKSAKFWELEPLSLIIKPEVDAAVGYDI